MDITQIKISPITDGVALVEMDANLIERFKLFCLVDFHIAKSVPNWVLNKIESHPDGRVVLHCMSERRQKN